MRLYRLERLAGGVRIEEFLKPDDSATFKRDDVDEVRFVRAAGWFCQTFLVPDDGNRIVAGKKLAWREREDVFGALTNPYPF
jgi:hypothetical protein